MFARCIARRLVHGNMRKEVIRCQRGHGSPKFGNVSRLTVFACAWAHQVVATCWSDVACVVAHNWPWSWQLASLSKPYTSILGPMKRWPCFGLASYLASPQILRTQPYNLCVQGECQRYVLLSCKSKFTFYSLQKVLYSTAVEIDFRYS